MRKHRYRRGCSSAPRPQPTDSTRILQAVALVLFSVFFISRAASAQNAQGVIVGHVADATGAALPGAVVSITDTATGVVHTLTSNSAGDYTLPALNPGQYSISVVHAGFQQQNVAGVTLQVAQTLRQDFSLPVGSQTEKVEVSADSQLLQTDDATVGQTIDDKLVQALPINGRDFTNLMLTNIGTNITPGGSGTDWSFHGLNNNYMEVSADGAQAQSTSYSIDGIYDADFFFSVPINIPNEDSIQEFKMLNGMYGAQYGQGSAQVNVAIKAGANRLHGNLYEALQANWLEPDNAYQAAINAETGSTTPVSTPYHQNQYGGTLSGPFWRDKAFWFGSYDVGRYNKINAATSAFVPTAQELTGNFSDYPYPIYNPLTTVVNPAYNSAMPVSAMNTPVLRTAFPNNQIPTAQLDPVALKLAAYYTTPNATSCTPTEHFLDGCTNYSANTQTIKKTNIGTARLDFYPGKADHVFFTGNVGTLTQTSTSIAFGQSGTLFTRPKLFGGTWTHTFGAHFLNQATLGYSRDHYLTGVTTAYGANLSADAGLANTALNPATYDLPNLSISQYQSIGGGEPTTYTDDIYQGVDTMTLVRGRHTMNFGVDFRRLQLYELDNYGGTGTLSFNGEYTSLDPALAGTGNYATNGAYEGNAFADFLLGDTNTATGPPPLGTDNYNLWGNNTNLFFQDDIRATNRLTINAGLRWERPANMHSNRDDGYALSLANGGQLIWANCNFTEPILKAGGSAQYLGCGASNTLVPIDNKDFAPRIGFSYQPQGLDQRAVIRGGFGIFYDTYNRYYDGTQFDKDALYEETAAVYTTPTGTETQSTAVVRNLWAAPTNAIQTFSSPSYEFDYNQVDWPKNHNPYNEQWNLDTQYTLTKSLLLDIGYVGGHGLRQPAWNIIGAGTLPRVAGDTCNNLASASLATGSLAYCLSDPNFQPVNTRQALYNLPPYEYANENEFSSNYNALQVQLIERAYHGLTYHLNYTYSKTLDVSSGYNLINGEPDLMQNPQNPSAQYGLSASNQKHRMVATYAYEIPGHLFANRFLNQVLTGWTTSGVFQLASGFPFAIYGSESADQEALYYGGRFLANSTFQRPASFHKTLSQNFDTGEYSNPELGTYGNTTKRAELTRYFSNWDASFGRTFHFLERESLFIRAEYFNLGSTWHASTSLLFPDSTVSDQNFGSLISPTYGSISLFNPHTLQLTAQFSF